jgi:heme/copper-type cytochrome/quinol oxidase subunit 3
MIVSIRNSNFNTVSIESRKGFATKLDSSFTRPLSHHFHLVNPSPWPIVVSFSVWVVMLNVSAIFHYSFSFFTGFDLTWGVLGLLFGVTSWWRDVIRESTYELAHSPIVRRGLLWGMALFIISEAFLFLGFFWAFFHASLVPSSAIGAMWPPYFLEVINPYVLPLVNTITLILSGFTLTISHKLLDNVDSFNTTKKLVFASNMTFWLFITVLLGAFFLQCQAFEYYFAKFTYTDTIYGTTFYSLTGLHGFHVLVGTIFLLVCFFRSLSLSVKVNKQTGYTAAIWYWHFVDIVWIGLFLIVYIWGGATRLA